MNERLYNYCECGSGLPSEPIFDGYGIYLTKACNACEKEKLSRFRADIFDRYECDEPIFDEEGYDE